MSIPMHRYKAVQGVGKETTSVTSWIYIFLECGVMHSLHSRCYVPWCCWKTDRRTKQYDWFTKQEAL